MALDHLPSNVAILWTGSRTTQSAFGPLPLAAGRLGMPGCTAWTSIDSLALVVGSGGRAAWSLTVPTRSALIGVRFHQQALVLDPGANALGAVLSDAATGVIGR